MSDIENKKFKVEKVVYYNSQKLWGVLGLNPVDDLGNFTTELINVYGSVTASGSFEKPDEGMEVVITGDIIVNPRYGKQIEIKSLQILYDTSSKEGIINYLARSSIEGIGIQLAEKIYEYFKDDTIDIVVNHTKELQKVQGIGEKTVEKVIRSVGFLKEHQETITFLTDMGIGYSTVMKLIEEFGEDTKAVIELNPYEILDVSKELSFKQVDEIYIKSGGDPKGKVRLETAFLYLLKQQVTVEGSTGCLRSSLSKKFYSMLDIAGSEDFFGNTMEALEEEKKIVLGSGFYVYYKEYLDIEREIAEKIKSLQKCYMTNNAIKNEVIEEEIKNFPFELNFKQKEAVQDCLNTNVAVLTSPAGGGKTSITKALYRIYIRSGFNVELLSPTAKAAIRLSECTGGHAQTIHKFLLADDGMENYQKNTVLIIDEASMMDIILFNKLLEKATLSTRILLVGDNNQLPSVQVGNVLGDIIDSNNVHVSFLSDIMRQKENSNIIKYCSMINEGEVFEPCEEHDFLYEEFDENDNDSFRKKFLKLYKKEVDKYGLAEVHVITPYKKGRFGMSALNSLLQQEMNSKNPEVMEGFRVGDKVRHTQNNYKKEVYNGETGVVCGFNSEEDILRVEYADKFVEYSRLDINELMLSYASTVHASQGSEYKVVFVILDKTAINDFLHIRRLLYTAVSRGKAKVYILSHPYLVDKCIANDTYKPRITKLKDFLK